MNLKEKGSLGEKIALNFLKKRGYDLVAKNLQLKKFGEIDLVVKKGNTFNFVEVKSLHSISDFNPEIHFTHKKLSKIIKLANFYSNRFNYENFIVSLVAINIKKKEIRYYENISQ